MNSGFIWTAVLFQIIFILFWAFIIVGFVMLIRNSNASKKHLQGIEMELKMLNLRNGQIDNYLEKP